MDMALLLMRELIQLFKTFSRTSCLKKKGDVSPNFVELLLKAPYILIVFKVAFLLF